VCSNVKIDASVGVVDSVTPGTRAGLETLESFVAQRLSSYGEGRNDPNMDALSRLSFWVNFGQISMHRCILYVKEKGKRYPEGVKSFVEEALIRRELSDNFCYYNDDGYGSYNIM
jgi:deoxyribodipyrimidine photo-lyase